MVTYWVTAPFWLKLLFSKKLTWEMPTGQPGTPPTVYITFDDGPHPQATTFAMEQLARFNAKATFFCVGDNVKRHPEIYQHLLSDGHSPGNHTFNHLNGWKTDTAAYLENIEKADEYIHSNAFRPPYGRIKFSQAKKLLSAHPDWNIYMWSVLSGDFDRNITPQKCAENVLRNIQPGSIVLFHDSEKAWDRMSYALPRVLEYCQNQGWTMKGLTR
jgi:peptidoglycan-N-acetylglucosamine deacetylase